MAYKQILEYMQIQEYKQILKSLVIPIMFIIVGMVARIIPHAPNFTPIAAMALFGGAYLNKKQAFILPILAMIFSDLVIGFDNIPMRLTVYGSFLIIVFIGLWLKNHNKFGNILTTSLFSSILFFVTTNFAVWAFWTMYHKTLMGLAGSYFYAIPFFGNTILGDLFYTGAFFGGYRLINIFVPGASVQKA